MNRRRLAGLLALALAAIVSVLAATNAAVLSTTRAFRYAEVAAVPPRPVALVLGAGLDPDGGPSGMLADRLDAGAALLRAGKVRSLLFSGDNGTVEHNELAAMQRYAVAHGVPAGRIALDYAGFDTYDSCYRARHIFGLASAVVVTQEFHLARAVYLCRSMGIDAVGLSTRDWGKFGTDLMVRQAAREVLARSKAVFEAQVSRRKPAILGSPEPLSSNS